MRNMNWSQCHTLRTRASHERLHRTRKWIPPTVSRTRNGSSSYPKPRLHVCLLCSHPLMRALFMYCSTLDFVPRKFSSLRLVPLYANGIRERFERCLDLYLCPRTMRRKMQVDPDSLLPKLPDASGMSAARWSMACIRAATRCCARARTHLRALCVAAELRPFPTTVATKFAGHTGRVRSVSADPTGQWLVSASDDKSVRLWEVSTGRCMGVWTFPDVPGMVAWCPNPAVALVAIATDNYVHILYPGTATPATAASTWDALRGWRAEEAAAAAAEGAQVEASGKPA
ncbi:hypothetical protein EON62_02550, partial [archaeon]